MSIGDRISDLRKQKHYSQEYLAAQLGVSRQAVSKWENNLSSPDTDNLIQLAALLGVSVEYLATGNNEQETQLARPIKRRLDFKKRHRLLLLFVLLSIPLLFGVVYCVRLPIDRDAGACGGGYATYIFDKYSNELVEKYWNGSDRKNEILSIETVRGTQEAEWEDRTITLSFDIRYEHRTEGTITERIRFIGHRYWFDTFRWGGAIIVG